MLLKICSLLAFLTATTALTNVGVELQSRAAFLEFHARYLKALMEKKDLPKEEFCFGLGRLDRGRGDLEAYFWAEGSQHRRIEPLITQVSKKTLELESYCHAKKSLKRSEVFKLLNSIEALSNKMKGLISNG